MASQSGDSHMSRSQYAFSVRSSAMYQSTLEGTGLHRETLRDRMDQTRRWIFNQDEGTILGRSPSDWLLYLCFHVGFFCLLIATSGAFCGLLYWHIDWNTPMSVNSSSLLQTPGLGFRPMPFTESRLIRLVKGDYLTYRYHIDHIAAYVEYYENELQQGDNYMDCSDITGRRPENSLDKACVFDILVGLGKDNPCLKVQDYGYGDGNPCILLKLNKIVNWMPEEFTNETVPDAIRDKWADPYWVYVHCTGDDATTRDNLGDIAYYPNNGFHFKYFPFRNQQGYRSPIMFIQLTSPQIGVLLFVTCRAYARNIALDDHSEIGQVSFQVMVD